MTLSRTQWVVLIVCVLGAFVALGVVITTKKGVPVEVSPDVAPTEETVTQEIPAYVVAGIGSSTQGRSIESYTFGSGETHLLLVGGIHGGYEWNSTLLAYEAIDYLKEDPARVPRSLRITVVPSLNPDGLYAVLKKEGRFSSVDVPSDEGPLGTGRFNARGVDLNRNFDCKWKSESTWRGKKVSAGTAPFSEPEAQTLKDFVETEKPVAVVFWHSQANAVYASECENGILPGTRTLMNLYGDAAGYPKVDVFDAYPVTGDAEGWLASIGIPAITVELKTHEEVEWERNRVALDALLAHYATVQ